MKKLFLIVFLFFVSVALFGQNREVTVYTAGYYMESGVEKACYWVGTEQIILSVPIGATRSRAQEIIVNNNIVYTTGWYIESDTTKACYWVGTVRIDLNLPPGGLHSSTKKPIAVENGIVYVASDYAMHSYNSVGNWRAAYWRGTEFFELPRPNEERGATPVSIAVENGEVYIAGSYGVWLSSSGTSFRSRVFYWSGNQIIILPTPQSSYNYYVTDINVVNGIVYISGGYLNTSFPDSRACYWRGAELITINIPGANTAMMLAITVTNDTVHSIIHYQSGQGRPQEWFLGIGTARGSGLPLPLGVSSYRIYSITEKSGAVYMSGNYTESNTTKVCYWIGNVRTDIGTINGSPQGGFIFVR